MKVYVSSTYTDLRDCRVMVNQAIRRLGHVDVAMENYVAEPERPVDKCLADVADCDLYVGIFAWRYGHIPSQGEKSITEQELRQAVASNKPILAFLLHEDAPWPRAQVEDGEGRAKLEALRNEITQEYVVSFFYSCEDLDAKVTAAIANFGNDSTAPYNADREHRLLKTFITSDDPIERSRASSALLNMRSQGFAELLRTRLVAREGNRQETLVNLGALIQAYGSAPQTAPMLVDLLQDRDPDVRRMTVFYIGELLIRGRVQFDPRVIDALITLSKDPQPGIRRELAHTLGKVANPGVSLEAVVGCLRDLTQDTEESVRSLADDSLRFHFARHAHRDLFENG